MKYLIILSLLLTGCGSFHNPENIKFGDKVQVTDGIYEGCFGYVTDSIDWIGPCQHEFMIKPFIYPNGSKSLEMISVCDLKKIKE